MQRVHTNYSGYSRVLRAAWGHCTLKMRASQGARAGIRKMVTLVWSKEAAIKAVVIESYQKLFLSQKCTENAQAEGRAMALNFIK